MSKEQIIICKICTRECKNYNSLARHVQLNHKLNKKQYYDQFLKKEGEGQCLECGKSNTIKEINKTKCEGVMITGYNFCLYILDSHGNI